MPPISNHTIPRQTHAQEAATPHPAKSHATEARMCINSRTRHVQGDAPACACTRSSGARPRGTCGRTRPCPAEGRARNIGRKSPCEQSTHMGVQRSGTSTSETMQTLGVQLSERGTPMRGIHVRARGWRGLCSGDVVLAEGLRYDAGFAVPVLMT